VLRPAFLVERDSTVHRALTAKILIHAVPRWPPHPACQNNQPGPVAHAHYAATYGDDHNDCPDFTDDTKAAPIATGT
jgi:hypothetical protein